MRRFALSFLALALSAAAFAQGPQLPELPMDPAVRKGKLDNGMTYYIRHNDKPAQRAEFYLATNVGAIQEEPDQDGLAHFLEHMCFNGTKNFPGKGIINWLESIGASFGGNVNASTGVESTQYMLNNIPLVRETVIDTCLLIMHDYSHFVTCDPAEIDAERGVILEEKRSRNNAQWRMYEEMRKYIFKRTKYVGCSIIGSEDNLKTFKPESLTTFYHTWYRPDMQALVVVGDVDVDQVEAKIKAIFADIPAAENPKQKEVISIPDNENPIIGIVTDPEATSTQVYVMWKSEPLPEMFNNTVQGLTIDVLKDLISLMLNERLDDIAAGADAPFLQAGFGVQKMCETMEATLLMASSEDGKILPAMEAALTEVARMQKYGFTDAELQRAKSELLSRYETRANKADTRKNAEFVRPIINNFFDNGDVMDPKVKLEYVSGILDNVDLKTVNMVASQMVSPANMVVVYQAPQKEGLVQPTEEQLYAVVAQVESADIQPLDGEEIPSEFVDPASLKGSKVKKSRSSLYGATEWTIRNGVKVVLLPTDYEKDRVSIYLTKSGGLSLVDDKDISQFDANIISAFSQMSGVSKYSSTQVDKMLAGKQVSVSPFYTETASGFVGSSTRKDIETALQLLYLNYTDPRFDQTEYDNAIKSLSSVLPNLESNPNYILQKELTEVLYGGNPRERILSQETLDEASMPVLEEIVRGILRKDAAGVFVYIVGDFDLKEVKPMVEKYIGSLPKGKHPTEWIDRGVEITGEPVTDDFKVAMTTPKVTVAQIFKSGSQYSVDKALSYSALRYILNMVYVTTLREEEGGTYGASVNASLYREPKQYGVLQIFFETNEEKADRLREVSLDGLRSLAKDGPTEEQFDKTVQNLRKRVPERQITNAYWQDALRRHYQYGEDYVAEYQAALDALTPDMVKAAAQEFLDGNLIELVMRPE